MYFITTINQQGDPITKQIFPDAPSHAAPTQQGLNVHINPAGTPSYRESVVDPAVQQLFKLNTERLRLKAELEQHKKTTSELGKELANFFKTRKLSKQMVRT